MKKYSVWVPLIKAFLIPIIYFAYPLIVIPPILRNMEWQQYTRIYEYTTAFLIGSFVVVPILVIAYGHHIFFERMPKGWKWYIPCPFSWLEAIYSVFALFITFFVVIFLNLIFRIQFNTDITPFFGIPLMFGTLCCLYIGYQKIIIGIENYFQGLEK